MSRPKRFLVAGSILVVLAVGFGYVWPMGSLSARCPEMLTRGNGARVVDVRVRPGFPGGDGSFPSWPHLACYYDWADGSRSYVTFWP